MSLYYVGTRKVDEADFSVDTSNSMVPGWAEDVATELRHSGVYADVRVFPVDEVDRLVESGQVDVTTT